MAHVAPWLLRQQEDRTDQIFCTLPDYQAQISHAIHSLSTVGVQSAAVVFADEKIRAQLQASIEQAARHTWLHMQEPPLPRVAASRTAPAEPIVLFVGGTPELYEYVHRLRLPAGRQCYVVALGDVNLQVLMQMGNLPQQVAVIATQSVPVVTAGLPVVRAYREILARLYDEPPSPLGLAGFIAAQYTADVLTSIPGPITRANVLATLRQRSSRQHWWLHHPLLKRQARQCPRNPNHVDGQRPH